MQDSVIQNITMFKIFISNGADISLVQLIY